MVYPAYPRIANIFRPFFRRLRIVFRPSAVDIRARKPDSFKTERLVLLDNVRFVIIKMCKV